MKRRKFSREFKVSVVEELEEKSLAEVCREHDLHPTLVTRWKSEYNKSPKEAFSGSGNVWKQEAKIAKYERLIGQLYAENAFLKKVLENLRENRAEQRKR